MHAISGRLSSSLPFMECAKLNIFAQFECVDQGFVGAGDSRIE
jgi:hypothetical protein